MNTGPWTVARLVAGVQVDRQEIGILDEPWRGAATAVLNANGGGAINALRTFCDELPDGAAILKAVLAEDPSKKPKTLPLTGLLPPLPGEAQVDPAAAAGAGVWLDKFTGYAKAVSPLTPDLFHEGAGLWLVSLAIARRVLLSLAHKEVYPNIMVLQVAPTTLYAKSTGLAIPRLLATNQMRYLLLPGEMTPEAMVDELAGKQPPVLEGLDIEEWQKGQAYAGQRGISLDEASSLFVGMSKDYNIGMGETLLRLYDCEPHISRQTRGTGRSTVRNAYFSFLGATTPWHLKKADVDSLWHTGLWPRFLLLTPDKGPTWCTPSKTRAQIPSEVTGRIKKLLEHDLPESKYMDPAQPLYMGLGEGVFDAYSRYLKATMHTLLQPPSVIDARLYGVYGRLAEHALKVSMLLAVLDWDGNGAPVIGMRHWVRAQLFVEQCRASAHRLPAMLAETAHNEDENKILMWLTENDDWQTCRDIYRALNTISPANCKMILADLLEAGLVESQQQGKTIRYRVAKDGADELS